MFGFLNAEFIGNWYVWKQIHMGSFCIVQIILVNWTMYYYFFSLIDTRKMGFVFLLCQSNKNPKIDEIKVVVFFPFFFFLFSAF